MLKTSRIIKSTTRPGKGGVEVGGNGGKTLTSKLRMSSSTDSSSSVNQVAVKYVEVDSGGGKLVEKLSKSRRIIKS